MWLSELYALLWDQPKREKIFRDTTLTFDDFLRLDNGLNKLKTSRGSASYESCKVFEEKLQYLLSPISLSENTDKAEKDNNAVESKSEAEEEIEGEDQDDRHDYQYYFPIGVKYLDLHSLSLQNRPQRCPSLIYIREEYEVISRILEHKRKEGLIGSAIVSGQPGIGETSNILFALTILTCTIRENNIFI